MSVTLADRPETMVQDIGSGCRKSPWSGCIKLLDRIAEQGGNVASVHHEHSNEGSDVNGCYLRLILETRNFEHITGIKRALTDAGSKIVE